MTFFKKVAQSLKQTLQGVHRTFEQAGQRRNDQTWQDAGKTAHSSQHSADGSDTTATEQSSAVKTAEKQGLSFLTTETQSIGAQSMGMPSTILFRAFTANEASIVVPTANGNMVLAAPAGALPQAALAAVQPDNAVLAAPNIEPPEAGPEALPQAAPAAVQPNNDVLAASAEALSQALLAAVQPEHAVLAAPAEALPQAALAAVQPDTNVLAAPAEALPQSALAAAQPDDDLLAAPAEALPQAAPVAIQPDNDVLPALAEGLCEVAPVAVQPDNAGPAAPAAAIPQAPPAALQPDNAVPAAPAAALPQAPPVAVQSDNAVPAASAAALPQASPAAVQPGNGVPAASAAESPEVGPGAFQPDDAVLASPTLQPPEAGPAAIQPDNAVPAAPTVDLSEAGYAAVQPDDAVPAAPTAETPGAGPDAFQPEVAVLAAPTVEPFEAGTAAVQPDNAVLTDPTIGPSKAGHAAVQSDDAVLAAPTVELLEAGPAAVQPDNAVLTAPTIGPPEAGHAAVQSDDAVLAAPRGEPPGPAAVQPAGGPTAGTEATGVQASDDINDIPSMPAMHSPDAESALQPADIAFAKSVLQPADVSATSTAQLAQVWLASPVLSEHGHSQAMPDRSISLQQSDISAVQPGSATLVVPALVVPQLIPAESAVIGSMSAQSANHPHADQALLNLLQLSDAGQVRSLEDRVAAPANQPGDAMRPAPAISAVVPLAVVSHCVEQQAVPAAAFAHLSQPVLASAVPIEDGNAEAMPNESPSLQQSETAVTQPSDTMLVTLDPVALQLVQVGPVDHATDSSAAVLDVQPHTAAAAPPATQLRPAVTVTPAADPPGEVDAVKAVQHVPFNLQLTGDAPAPLASLLTAVSAPSVEQHGDVPALPATPATQCAVEVNREQAAAAQQHSALLGDCKHQQLVTASLPKQKKAQKSFVASAENAASAVRLSAAAASSPLADASNTTATQAAQTQPAKSNRLLKKEAREQAKQEKAVKRFQANRSSHAQRSHQTRLKAAAGVVRGSDPALRTHLHHQATQPKPIVTHAERTRSVTETESQTNRARAMQAAARTQAVVEVPVEQALAEIEGLTSCSKPVQTVAKQHLQCKEQPIKFCKQHAQALSQVPNDLQVDQQQDNVEDCPSDEDSTTTLVSTFGHIYDSGAGQPATNVQRPGRDTRYADCRHDWDNTALVVSTQNYTAVELQRGKTIVEKHPRNVNMELLPSHGMFTYRPPPQQWSIEMHVTDDDFNKGIRIRGREAGAAGNLYIDVVRKHFWDKLYSWDEPEIGKVPHGCVILIPGRGKGLVMKAIRDMVQAHPFASEFHDINDGGALIVKLERPIKPD